ncbi:MAG: type II toxin-antitoxin system RelE/ParE family toxin [Gemmatimonadota bacterium]
MPEPPFLGEAREEFLAAVAYYNSASPGLGEEFIGEVERAVERLLTFPDYGSTHLSGTRRVVLWRFPFDIVYLSDTDAILVVAVAHHRRSPGYWRERVPSPHSAHDLTGA